jgi:hypothetical protein
MLAGYQMASEKERRWLIFLLPFVLFFPGLLGDATMLCGNVADIFYGVILIAAIPGWKRNKWFWFYVAVVAASACKAPMLTLLAFPVLVGKRQWAPAGIAGAVGCLLFGIQPFLWPAQFQQYLLSLRLSFDWTHNFGFGPAGVLGDLLQRMHRPYSPAITFAYLVWAAALGALLLTARFRLRSNPALREAWIPVALIGTILLNPRVSFHDTPPLTIPMILIAWRGLLLGKQGVAQWRSGRAFSTIQSAPLQTARNDRRNLVLILIGASWFAACNIIDIIWGDWVPMELTVLLVIFSLGIWSLFNSKGDLVMENL